MHLSLCFDILSSRSQPAIGFKQIPKSRPTIFGCVTDRKSPKTKTRLRHIQPQMLSLSQMFDISQNGYTCALPSNSQCHALIFQDSHLTAGSLEALIQHLVPTDSYYPDRTYVFAFLLNSRLFIRPHELLCKVCEMCASQQDPSNNWSSKDSSVELGSRVMQLLSEWAELFPYDFRDERMMKQFEDITEKIGLIYPDLRKSVGNISHNLLNRLGQLDLYEESLYKYNVAAVKKSQSHVVPTTDITESCTSPLHLAQQLTHLELERLSHIGPEEFVQAFAKESIHTVINNMKKTKNLEAYIQWFNRLSYFVATEICSHLKKKNRVKIVEYFMDVAKECINIGNFNSLMAIIAGMNMIPVARLKKMWAKVNLAKFEILEHQMNPSHNFGSYRSCLKAAMWRSEGAVEDREKIVVPFFSLFVKDLYFINEGCANKLQNGAINFEKFWQMAKQISDFIGWQQVKCPFKKNVVLQNYILTMPVFSETTLSLASYECEQPETNYDRERHRQLKTQAGL
ncbi:hypothetical protein ScPMuIL_003497 [Solemya velum]